MATVLLMILLLTATLVAFAVHSLRRTSLLVRCCCFVPITAISFVAARFIVIQSFYVQLPPSESTFSKAFVIMSIVGVMFTTIRLRESPLSTHMLAWCFIPLFALVAACLLTTLKAFLQ